LSGTTLKIVMNPGALPWTAMSSSCK
jgi:hypothetical protein